MKRSAKQLTFIYFSVVAFAIITIHASVFISTAENMEMLYAENRLSKISQFVRDTYPEPDLKTSAGIQIQTQGKTDFDPYVEAYFNPDHLPEFLGMQSNIPLGQAHEVVNIGTGKTYFVLRETLASGDGDMLLVLDNSFYELTEEQLLATHTKQALISLVLGFLSLLIVLKISDRLTRPVANLARDLTNREPESLEPIAMPTGTSTKEVFQLVQSFNAYQARIKSLVERERSFNRYASHELRTPLMIMKGAITLLGESHEPAFIEKQKARLEKATDDMNEFVQTLLSLTKISSDEDIITREVSREEIQEVLENHAYLLSNKPVIWKIETINPPKIRIPDAAFRILLGNLIKNAFAQTREGCVTVHLNNESITITDTGIGLQNTQDRFEGFGLGLLLVNDICRRFDCVFELTENDSGGCTARVVFGGMP